MTEQLTAYQRTAADIGVAGAAVAGQAVAGQAVAGGAVSSVEGAGVDIRLGDSAVWSFEVVDAPHLPAPAPRGSLGTARGRVVSLVLNDQSTASWVMDWFQPGTWRVNPEVTVITPRNSDVIVYRDTTVVFRGRITTHEVQAADTGQVTVAVSAMSYKGLLKNRFLLDGDCRLLVNATSGQKAWQRNYTAGSDVGAIVWDLIKVAQTPAYGTLGIGATADGIAGGVPAAMTSTTTTIPSIAASGAAWTGGNGNTGLTTNAVTELGVGTSIFTAIEQLAAGNAGVTDFGAGPVNTTGFEWDIIPDPVSGVLGLHVWPLSRAAPHSPGRGEQNGYVLDYGGTVQSSACGYDTGDYANLVRVSAGDTAVARLLGGGDPVNGLWEAQESVPVAFPASGGAPVSSAQGQLDTLAAATYMIRAAVRASYRVVLRPGAYRDGDFAVGDTCVVQVPNMEGVVSDAQRVLTQTFAPGDSGGETVTATLGAMPLFTVGAAAARQRAANAAYRKLARALFGNGV